MEDVESAVVETPQAESAPVEVSIDDTLAEAFDSVHEEDSTPDTAKETATEPLAPDVKQKSNATTEVTPPVSWTKEAKENFKALPQRVKEEVLKREQDYMRGIQHYSGYKKAVEQITQVAAPYQARLKAIGADLPTAIGNLLNYDHVLSYGSPQQKAQAMQTLIQAYNITPDMIQTQEAPYIDPDIRALQERLGNTERMLQQEQQKQYRSMENEVVNEFQQFASDPKNEYFQHVRHEMGQYIKSGVSPTLKDAYERAVWAHPQIRERLIVGQRAAQVQGEKAKAAQAKLTARTNVKSNGTINGSAKNSFEDTLSAAWDMAQQAR